MSVVAFESLSKGAAPVSKDVSIKTKGYNNMKQWYEELFENYGVRYDNECFTQGTIGECDFIEKEIGYDKSLRILDIGCGTGRHAIELTKRGYTVVGVDLSDSQLERARQKASMDNLQIHFKKHDARNLPFLREFDLVIMLCEGGFTLMETDEMNYQILRNASNALTHKGKLIFTTLNALFPLFHSVRQRFLRFKRKRRERNLRQHFIRFNDFSGTQHRTCRR